jgi:hypothetical protein
MSHASSTGKLVCVWQAEEGVLCLVYTYEMHRVSWRSDDCSRQQQYGGLISKYIRTIHSLAKSRQSRSELS